MSRKNRNTSVAPSKPNPKQPVQNSPFEVVSLSSESAKAKRYDNHPIAKVNDHEVRISTMTEAYHWHCHPDSDESFLVLEGGLFIDFDDRTIKLLPGQMLTVNRGIRHRTRPVGERSVNLTFERAHARSEMLASPSNRDRENKPGDLLKGNLA